MKLKYFAGLCVLADLRCRHRTTLSLFSIGGRRKAVRRSKSERRGSRLLCFPIYERFRVIAEPIRDNKSGRQLKVNRVDFSKSLLTAFVSRVRCVPFRLLL